MIKEHRTACHIKSIVYTWIINSANFQVLWQKYKTFKTEITSSSVS